MEVKESGNYYMEIGQDIITNRFATNQFAIDMWDIYQNAKFFTMLEIVKTLFE